MKKTVSFFAIALVLGLVLAACGDSEQGAVTDSLQTTAETVTEEPAYDTPDLPDPETLDIAGEFHILVSGNYNRNDFQSEGETGTAVDIAVYRRNERIKEKYGVEVINEDVIKFNSATGGGTGFSKIYTDYMSGESNYDAALIGTYDVATLAYSGYIHDLNDLPYVDLSKSYWDQKANADLSINGKMYYTTGDITTVDNMVTHAILFNKDMIDSYGLDDPYTLVKDGEWTFENFGRLVKAIGEDVNQDGIYNENDRYGLMTWKDSMLAVLAAAGEKICAISEDGAIELTLYNERVVNLYDQYQDIAFDFAHAYNYQYDSVSGKHTATATWDVNRDAIFTENRAAFYMTLLTTVARHRDSEIDFGILPYPKLEEEQESYNHSVSAFHNMFICVPELAADYERSGIILEELAYEGKKLLTPAYYDQTLVGKSVRDEESVEMLDIIFSTRVFDVGQYYNIGTYKEQLGSVFVSRASIASMYETYRTAAENKITMINRIMQDLQ